MGQIIITVKALNWTCGNIGYVSVLLNGGSCRIDWGDGHVSSISVPPYSKKPEWYGASHAYPASCMAAEERFNIYVSSGDDDNIIGIDADSGDMNVDDVDIRGCQSIKHFSASYLISHFDLTGNPGIETVYLRGEACRLADFSNSVELRNLMFCHNGCGRFEKVEKLDLSKCDKLEYLDCCYAWELKDIVISNRSALKEFVYNDKTPLSGKSLGIIRRIIGRNGGKITKGETYF